MLRFFEFMCFMSLVAFCITLTFGQYEVAAVFAFNTLLNNQLITRTELKMILEKSNG